MRTNRLGRFLRRASLVLLPLLAAACASSDGTAGGGPSQDRTMEVVALVIGLGVVITLGALMYADNRD